MFPMKNFLKTIRDSRGITQEELAEALGTSQATICKIENGQQRLNDVLIKKIIEILKCSADELLFGITADEREKKLLDYFRNSDESGQDLLLKTGDTVSKLASKEKGSLNETG